MELPDGYLPEVPICWFYALLPCLGSCLIALLRIYRMRKAFFHGGGAGGVDLSLEVGAVLMIPTIVLVALKLDGILASWPWSAVLVGAWLVLAVFIGYTGMFVSMCVQDVCILRLSYIEDREEKMREFRTYFNVILAAIISWAPLFTTL